MGTKLRLQRLFAWLVVGLLALTAFVSCLAGVSGFGYGRAAADIHHHAAITRATVDAIDPGSPGGDPFVRYHFLLGDTTYTGSGPGGQLGNPPLRQLHP